MIPLSHISSTTKRFQTYVANRVNEIRESSDRSQWRHCPGELNPADDCSHGLDAQRFIDNERWLRGPKFLWSTSDSWPDHNFRDVPDSELEIKKERMTCATSIQREIRPLLYDLLERYSSWMKLLKTIAWLCKFQDWLRKGKRLEYNKLTVNDLTLAKQKGVNLIQRQSFPDEIRDLRRQESNETLGACRARVKISSSIVKLKPMMCKDGILRVSGRISEAPITFDAKHQMILPQTHHVTVLIIRHFHGQLGHCGQETIVISTPGRVLDH